MSFDSHCYDLAIDFLRECPVETTQQQANELAQLIQTTIEYYLKTLEDNDPSYQQLLKEHDAELGEP